MSDIHTKYCVQCGDPAKRWSGHILQRGQKIAAGWCDKHAIYKDGFVGHYRKWMGQFDSELEEEAKP